jgi:hypothetical protein
MTAKTAAFIVECVVDKTFNDHYSKCNPTLTVGGRNDYVCTHVTSGNLDVARAVESGMKIGKKRATLDLACPFSTNESHKQIKLLKNTAWRVSEFAKMGGVSDQVRNACERIVSEITDYAHRNAMEVIAEAAL